MDGPVIRWLLRREQERAGHGNSAFRLAVLGEGERQDSGGRESKSTSVASDTPRRSLEGSSNR
jgi:hypothetical protein